MWRAGGAHAWVVGGAHAPRCWRWKVPQNFCGENLEVSNQAQKLQSRSAENGGAWFWGRPAGSIKPPGIAGTRTDPKSLHPPLLLLHPPLLTLPWLCTARVGLTSRVQLSRNKVPANLQLYARVSTASHSQHDSRRV